MKEKKIAVFFDCENISANHVPSIFDELANYGEVIIKQSFKDWSSSNNKSWNQELHEEFAIEPIQVFKSKSAKNSSDLRIQRAVMEIMNKKNIDIIVLVSSDSDFRDLAMSIRADNFEAIGKISALINEQLSHATKAELVKLNKEIQHIFTKLQKAEKSKYESDLQKIDKFKEQLFPNNSLQERYAAWIPYYLRYGKNLITEMRSAYDLEDNKVTVFNESQFAEI